MNRIAQPMIASSRGFSLVELAVVVTVVGLVMGGLMVALGPYLDMRKYEVTQQRLEKIADALANYAQEFYRLPCPANAVPGSQLFGSPRGSGNDGMNYSAACAAGAFNGNDYIGIVPFRAIGLAEDDVKDGFGNFITYEVSPILSGKRNGTAVHEQCRLPKTWIDGVNKNPGKAAFCCPRQDTAFTANNLSVWNTTAAGRRGVSQGADGYDASASLYAADNAAFSSGTNIPAASNEFIAYVLISHGRNGDSAFIKNSASRRPVSAGATTREQWNGVDTSLRNVAMPVSTIGSTEYFDDLVLWRTNIQVMSEFGNDSCTRP